MSKMTFSCLRSISRQVQAQYGKTEGLGGWYNSIIRCYGKLCLENIMKIWQRNLHKTMNANMYVATKEVRC